MSIQVEKPEYSAIHAANFSERVSREPGGIPIRQAAGRGRRGKRVGVEEVGQPTPPEGRTASPPAYKRRSPPGSRPVGQSRGLEREEGSVMGSIMGFEREEARGESGTAYTSRLLAD